MTATERPGAPRTDLALAGATDDELTVAEVLAFFRRRRLTIAGVAAVITLLALAVILLLPRSYAAAASFTPEGRSSQSSFAGLASQFGVNIAGADANKSPAFYADLLQSRAILGAVVDSSYSIVLDGRRIRQSLADILEIKGATSGERRDKTIVALRSRLSAAVSPKTGIVSLAITTRYDWLSYEIIVRLLRQVDLFNLGVRQSNAGTERRFTEQRLSQVRQELRDSEDALQQFLQANRSMMNSPQLNFREQRMRRDLTILQGVYGTLAQALEQAKIESARDTPVITLIDKPELPARPEPRGTIRLLALALFAGVLGGVMVSLLLERRAKPSPTR